MIEKIKITFINNESKIIEVKDGNLQLAYEENNINSNDVKGIDKVGV